MDVHLRPARQRVAGAGRRWTAVQAHVAAPPPREARDGTAWRRDLRART
ncbi:hypothetical protein [Pseudofrankia inefficax]|nr:hypothetical protein [Pseudofrankia inefficax]